MNNSYIRKIHKQRNINCEKYVRYYFNFKIIIISLVKKSSGTQGRSVESKPKKNRAKVFKVGRESPWDATLDEPVFGLIRMYVSNNFI